MDLIYSSGLLIWNPKDHTKIVQTVYTSGQQTLMRYCRVPEARGPPAILFQDTTPHVGSKMYKEKRH